MLEIQAQPNTMAEALQTSLDNCLHNKGPASPQPQSPAPTTTPSSSRPKGRATRGPKRYVPQPTNLEVVDDTLGPLGPLGAAPSEDAVDEPTQEQASPVSGRQTAPPPQSGLAGFMASVQLDDDDGEDGGQPRARVPPPVQPPLDNTPAAFRQVQPSVSIVEAAKPSFSIQVGDPHKVGDLTSAHTEYNVYTKVISVD
jgi:sorting nexin-1/2